ncbi:unnamed protein product [Cercopithifilaria johnstoni]|uniref:Uncharacterized protein n=1 Tax=Cercopithifilaria johnstoni TaxID=2874296 RepID=A0A8J2LVQ2_9BILA|nr:unnamed protein product [Cercopithifilaria johnstoni]
MKEADEENDRGKSRSRKRKKVKGKGSKRKSHRSQKFEDSDEKDDVSCCGRPKRKSDSRRRRKHHHHRKHKSKRSQKDMVGTKDEISSSVVAAPPVPQSQQPIAATSVAVSKEKLKEEKESGEVTNTNQGKQSTSGEIAGQGKLSGQLGASQISPPLPSYDNQKADARNGRDGRDGRESVSQIAMSKTELLQELCVTQCIRDGYEISRMEYKTCFPISKKPNFIYLPQLRFMANKSSTDTQKKSSTRQNATNLLHEITQPINLYQNETPDLTKLLATGEMLNEVHRYDNDTKTIINDLKYLQQRIHRKFGN